MKNKKQNQLKKELTYLKKQRLNLLRAKEPCPFTLDAQDEAIKEVEMRLKELNHG